MAKLITAKYRGNCAICGKPYAEGEFIRYDRTAPRRQRGKHVECRANELRQIKAEQAANVAAAIVADSAVSIALRTFDSPSALADAAAPYGRHGHGGQAIGEWSGGSMEDACRMARTGDDSLVPQAESLIDQLRVNMPETIRPSYTPAPYGAYPIVPEALAGYPLNMRARQRLEDDRSPVRIFVDLTVSGGCTHETIRARGISALALVMMASERRPIELFTVTALSHSTAEAAAVAVRINTQPLELATACHALTATSFFRRLGYDYLNKAMGSGGGWAWGILPDGAERNRYSANMRKALGLSALDLFIPPVWLHDQIAADAPTWLNDRLQELGCMEETETA